MTTRRHVFVDPAAAPEDLRLPIECVETCLVRVLLNRVYAGRAYRMTHRSTMIVRLHTAVGVIGEAYVGDEDAPLHETDRIVHGELAPRISGTDAFATERL